MFFDLQEARLGTNPESLDSLRPSSVALAFRSFGALIERESEGWSRLEAGRPARQNGVREGGDEDACVCARAQTQTHPLSRSNADESAIQPAAYLGRRRHIVGGASCLGWDTILCITLLNNGIRVEVGVGNSPTTQPASLGRHRYGNTCTVH